MMRLGKDKQHKLLVFLLFIVSGASGQMTNVHKYSSDNLNKGNNITINDNSIIIDYAIQEFEVESIINENEDFFRISIPGHSLTTDIGKPEFPVFGRLITIPEGYSWSVKISDVRSLRINPASDKIKGRLYPAQEREAKTPQKKPVFIIDKEVYSRPGFLMNDTVSITPLGSVRKKNLANLFISPVSYNPNTNILRVITSMKIEILFTATPGSILKALSPDSYVFSETMNKGVLDFNPDNVVPGYSDKPSRMIIVTDTTFKEYLDPYIRWKTQKGFKLDILYRGNKYAGVDYTSIKNSIKSIYTSSTEENPPPDYLLIIGDVNKIPFYGTGNVTDLYYGEFDGNGDYLPEMFIGRLPVADTSELRTVISKLIQYEKYEFADNNKFVSNALATAGYDETKVKYMNGQVYYGITNYLNSGNKINEFHFYYPESATAKDSIIKLINKGLSFINYSGHGESSGWLHLNIKTQDIPSFTNRNMYPFVISNACHTSQFNLANAFGNKLVTAKDKGAVGFIGCSNYSYWDEDFYWAVGTGIPTAEPAYQTTGLGALDRLFHTHGETPSDWYFTMGQINYSGNLSVSSSTSSLKKYYWETYNLVGDPSIIPFIGTPETFNLVLPDTLPNNMRSYSFITEPFAYAAISHSDTLWDASFASPSGSVTFDMPGISDDSCIVVITGQNRKPLIKTIFFSDVDGEFINMTDITINDEAENNNGKADFGETFYLDFKLSNLGNSAASNIYAIISASSDWVTINTDSVRIDYLPGLTETEIINKLSVTIDRETPDLCGIVLNITLKDEATSRQLTYDIYVHSPVLEILSCSLDDSETGNDNGVADPGETLNLVFHVINRGSSNTTGDFNLSSISGNIDILDPSTKSGLLQFGEISDITMLVKLPETINQGESVTISASLDCDPHFADRNFTFRIGRIRESFESANFRIFPWINLSQKPWTITGTGSFEGIMAARSGAISHNSSSSLIMKVFYNTNDTLKFYYKVSSEQSYDFLLFRLNDAEILKKSGEVQWERASIPVKAGYNKLEWIYKKDISKSSGTDCAMIDLIDFAGPGSVRYIQKDLATAKIVSPAVKEHYDKEPVMIKVLNLGPDTIRGFKMAYILNKGIPVVQNFPATVIPMADSVTVTFNTSADMSKYGIYNMTVYVNEPDDYTKNDTLKISIQNTNIDEPLMVFPNPFKDELKIVINADIQGKASISIYNQLGSKIFETEKDIIKGDNTITINTRHFIQSVYYLKINYPGISRTIPVLKTN